MSIYDLPSDQPEKPQPSEKKPEPKPSDQPPAATLTSSGSIYAQQEPANPTATRQPAAPKQNKKRRRGCGSCMLGCLGMLAVLILITGLGGWVAWSQWPDWTRNAIVSTIEETNLEEDEKQAVIEQVDRLVDGYKTGEVSGEQLMAVLEGIGESPISAVMFAGAAYERFIRPSGLDEVEKQLAQVTMQRVAQGVVDEKIDRQMLDEPLNYISTVDPNGTRHLKDRVSDKQLRSMLLECKDLADEARVPRLVIPVNVGNELKQVVDQALDSEWP